MSALRLAAGDAHVVVDPEIGGRLTSLVIAGQERLLSAPGDRTADGQRMGWGCFLMAPWPGRLAGAAFEWRGRTRTVPRTHGAHAIHGVALDAEWTVRDAAADSAELGCDLAEAGWPLGGAVRQRVAIAPGRLTLDVEVVAGPEGSPAAVGWHPWFRRPERGDLVVEVEASHVLRTDDELIPDGSHAPVEGDLDLRGGPPLGQRRLDHAYVRAREPVRVRWPDVELAMASDVAEPTYVVHTPPRGVCVEPQSAWPNALALHASHPTGLRALGPGEPLAYRCTWEWRVLSP